MIDLCHLDEAGFAPTLPTSYSWALVGRRLTVPYEAPQGRRVNVIGAYFSHGLLTGMLRYEAYASLPKSKAKKARRSPAERAIDHGVPPEEVGSIDEARFIAFVWRIAGRPSVYWADWRRERPLVVVVDNYSVHKSGRVQAEQAAWEAAGVSLFYLPSYSPELSAIEPIWHATKQHELPRRSYDQLGALKQAVEAALDRKATQLMPAHTESANLLRAAA